MFFFAKYRDGLILFMSRANRERHGIQDEAAVVGLTDHDLVRVLLVARYVRDDAVVMDTGEPQIGRVEL